MGKREGKSLAEISRIPYIKADELIFNYKDTVTSKRRTYIKEFCCFDIETTRLKDVEQSIMYIWQFRTEKTTIYGRTWTQFETFLHRLMEPLPAGVRIVIYVHNLSYEFQFLRGIYNFTTDEVFATESRKVLKCTMYDCLEFRCSYFLSNMSLSEFLDKMKVPITKLDDYDYTKVRYPYTPMTDHELEYCFHDVEGLHQAITKSMEIDGDNIATIPLTSTGYVRRDCRKALMKPRILTATRDMLPDYNVYKLLRQAFRGGDTHANRYYTGKIVKDVYSADRSSSYPGVQMNCDFPMTQFVPLTDLSIHNIEMKIERHRALLFTAVFEDIELSDKFFGCPYIPFDKCTICVDGDRDNGRILSARILEITLTDIDYKIILKEYKWRKITISVAYSARYGKLPQTQKDVIESYFTLKTALKGVPGKEVEYMKSKNKLNSIYGMSAQNPVKQDIKFNGIEFERTLTDEEYLLQEYNDRAFMPYQHGVWTTAHARLALHEGIWLVGDDFIYCDTDSVKYINKHSFEDYNAAKIKESTESGAYATDKHGITHYMEVYEDDGYYKRFVTLGAKKYAYEYADGKLGVTVAGVSKKYGAEELGRLENFKPGFIWSKAGGLESVFNDVPEITEYTTPDGYILDITPNIVLRESTYKLGITAEYERLLQFSNFIGLKHKEMFTSV